MQQKKIKMPEEISGARIETQKKQTVAQTGQSLTSGYMQTAAPRGNRVAMPSNIADVPQTAMPAASPLQVDEKSGLSFNVRDKLKKLAQPRSYYYEQESGKVREMYAPAAGVNDLLKKYIKNKYGYDADDEDVYSLLTGTKNSKVGKKVYTVTTRANGSIPSETYITQNQADAQDAQKRYGADVRVHISTEQDVYGASRYEILASAEKDSPKLGNMLRAYYNAYSYGNKLQNEQLNDTEYVKEIIDDLTRKDKKYAEAMKRDGSKAALSQYDNNHEKLLSMQEYYAYLTAPKTAAEAANVSGQDAAAYETLYQNRYADLAFLAGAGEREALEMQGLGGAVATANERAAYQQAQEETYNAKEYLKSRGYSIEQIEQTLATYSKAQNAINAQAAREEYTAFAQEHPVLANAASLALTPAKGISGIISPFADPGDPNSPFLTLTDYSNSVTGTTRDMIDHAAQNLVKNMGMSDKAAEWAGRLGTWGYSALYSMVESQIAMAAGPGVGEALLATQAAASAYQDGLNRGMDETQAIAYGVMGGVFEAAFEHLSLENLRGLKQANGGTLRTIIKNLGKSFITEGSEEIFTDIANEAYDYLINADKSNFRQKIKEYTDQGMSYEEACTKYTLDFLGQLAESGIVGGLSGLMGGSVSSMQSLTGAASLGAQVQEVGKSYEGGVKAMLGKAFGENAAANSRVLSIDEETGKLKTGLRVRSAYEALTEQQKDLLQSAFTRAGAGADVAKRAADVYAKLHYGDNADAGTITREDLLYLKDDNVQRGLEELFDGETFAERERSLRLFGLRVAAAAAKTGIRGRAAEFLEKWATKKELKQAEERKDAMDAATEAVKSGKAEEIDVPEVKATADGGRVRVSAVKGVTDGELEVVIDRSGATAKLADVAFENDSDRALYETVRDMMTGAGDYAVKMDADAANALLSIANKSTTDAVTFMQNAYAAYSAGTTMRNREVYQIESEYDLTGEELDFSYDLGLRQYKVQPGVTRVGKAQISRQQLNELRIIDEFAREKGLKVVVMDTLKGLKKTEDGMEVFSARGEVSAKDNVIYIALEAAGQENVLSVTMFHELFHWIGYQKGMGKASQNALINSVIKSLEANEKVDIEAIREQYRRAGYEGSEIDEDIAAQYFGTVIADAGMRQKLAKQNAPLWKRVVEHLKAVLEDLTERIKKAFAGDKAVQAAYLQDAETIRRHIKEFEGVLDKVIAETKAQRAEKAAQTETDKELTEAGIITEDESAVGGDLVYNAEGDFIAPSYSLATYEAGPWVMDRETMIRKIMEKTKVSREKTLKYIKSIDSVAAIIARNMDALDYDQTNDEGKTALKENSEYRFTIDFSTLCAKRLLFTGTFNEIQKALPDHAFTSEELLDLRKMMMERDYQVACGICYVESTRREMGPITEEFIRRYKEAQKTGKPISRLDKDGNEVALRRKVKKGVYEEIRPEKGYTPTLGDLNTTDIDKVRIEHKDVYDAYIAFMNARGQAKPKLLETRTAYKGEILRSFNNTRTVEARNRAGGLRIQSFSDFEIVHLIDMMQVIMDMSTVGLRGQAYTKVPAFARAMGKTGLKINLSLIAKGTGLDKDGNLIFDAVEGMDPDTAFKLREEFPETVGTILVGATDAHILKAMADPRIDFIIPFHKSSWRQDLYEQLGIRGYDDYTDTQNEKLIKKDGTESKKKIKNIDPTSYWDPKKTGDENAARYLEICESMGRQPKFPQFARDENGNVREGYWKLLIDFKMYDNNGVGVEQEAVRPEFDDAVMEELLHEYVKESPGAHHQFPVAEDVVRDFVKQRRGHEMRRQVEGLTGGLKYSKVLDQEYMDAVESGDEAEQARLVEQAAEEAMPESKVRNGNGKLLIMYHGTPDRFYVFDKNTIGKQAGYADGPGFYFSSKKTEGGEESAATYGENLMEVYLDIKHPLSQKQKTITKNRFTDLMNEKETEYLAWHKYLFDEIWDNATSDYYLYASYNHRTNDIRMSKTAWMDVFKELGYDGQILDLGEGVINCVVFDSEQIKSADPVTYDDDGNVIPLSERFNPEKEDIRWSRVINEQAQGYVETLKGGSRQRWEMVDILRDMADAANRFYLLDETEAHMEAWRKLARKYILTRERKGGGVTPEQVETFAKRLEDAYQMMSDSRNVDAVLYDLYTLMRKELMRAGHYTALEWYKDFRKEFRYNNRAVNVYIDQSELEKIRMQLGSLDELRRITAGRMNIVSDEEKADITLNDFYDQLADKYDEVQAAKESWKKISNLMTLYNAGEYQWISDKNEETAGMSLYDAASERSINLVADILKAGYGNSKKMREWIQRIGTLQEEQRELNRNAVIDVVARADAEYAARLDELDEAGLDSVAVEIEREKIKEEYGLKGLTKAYEDKNAKQWERFNGMLMRMSDRQYQRYTERLAKIRREYDEQYERQKQRHNEQVDKLVELNKKRNDQQQEWWQNRYAESKANWEEKYEKQQDWWRTYYKDRLKEKQTWYQDALIKDTRQRQIKQQLKALTDIFTNPKKSKFIPERMQSDLMGFIQLFSEDRHIISSDRLRQLLEVINKNMVVGVNEDTGSMFASFDEALKDRLGTLITQISEAENEKNQARMIRGQEPLQRTAIGINGKVYTQFMTVDQLDTLLDVVKSVRHLIDTVNEITVQGKKQSLNDVGGTLVNDVNGRAKNKRLLNNRRNKAFKRADDIVNNKMLTPIYFFREKIGSVLIKIYDDLRDAQDAWYLMTAQAEEEIRKAKEAHDYNEWKDFTKEFHFSDAMAGKWDVTLHVEAMLQIYATMKRQEIGGMESAHLNKGGIVLSEELKDKTKKAAKKVKEQRKKGEAEAAKKTTEALVQELNADRHELSWEQMQEIARALPQKAKDYADEIVKFMSTQCSDWGNKTSVELSGFRKFTEKYYFPYQSAENYIYKRIGLGNDSRLKNAGFTKNLVIGGSSPLVVSGFTQVAGTHMEEMARYAAFAAKIENLNRVWNFQETTELEDGTRIKAKSTVRSAIESVYGPAANQYIETFINQLNSGVRADPTDALINKASSWFKRAAVMGNMSVVIQQPTSLMRAMAVINPKYFLGAASYKDYQDMMAHAPVAGIKAMGGFDTNTGRSATKWIIGEKDWQEKTGDVLGKGAELADAVTWTNLWNAVKRETRDKTKLEYGSEEFYDAAYKRFRDVIDYTQVYDSTMSKSELMRSPSGLAKMVTAFMAEPTLSFNLITQSGIKSNGMMTNKGAALAAFAANIIVNSLFQSVVGAWRDRDEDEIYEEKLVKRTMQNLIGDVHAAFLDGAWSPVGMIPWVKDLISLWQGYDVDRSDVSVFSELIDALQDISGKLTDGKTLEIKDFMNLAGAISAITPVPVGKILDDVWGLYNTVNNAWTKDYTVTGDTMREAVLRGLGLNTTNKNKRAYEAVLNNDTEIMRRMTQVSEEDVRKQMEKGLSRENAEEQARINAQRNFDNLVATGLSENDPQKRVQKAAQLRMEGKQGEARMLIEDMIEDGFTQEQVYRAVNAEYQRLQPKEDEVSEGQAATMFQRQDLFDAMEADSEESFALVKEELLASGKSESSILSAVKEYAKTMYDDAAPREKIMHVLKDYGGMSDNEAKNQYDTIEKTWLEENEPRVQEAAEAWVAQNMTKANELIDEMTHEGFGVNAVRKAFRETLNDLLPDEEKADEYNDVDLYRNSDLRYALDNRNLTAFEEIARGIEEESGTDKRASVTKTYAREMYDEKPKNKAEILDVLQRFGGLTEAEALTEYDTIEKNWLLDNDERVQTAGEQWYAMDLDKSEATVDALIKDGYSKNAVLAAVRSVVNDLTPKSEKEKEYTDVQYYRNADLKNAISHNDKAAFNRIAGRIAEETGAESAEGVAKSYAKELYADTGDADQAAKVLTGYAGKTKDEAETITAWWEYQAKHADTVLTEASFGSYYDKIVKNNVGIPASVYEQFYAQKKEVKGLDENGDGKTDSGSKRNQVAAIIAKLKLTPAQKTALWDMQGYARKYMPNWQ